MQLFADQYLQNTIFRYGIFFPTSMDKLDIPGGTEIYRVKIQLSIIFVDDILIYQYIGKFVILVRIVTKPLLYIIHLISNSNAKPVIYR